MFLNKIQDLNEGDIFLYENDLCKVDKNKQISTSYNEVLFSLQEGSGGSIENSIRERKDKKIVILERSKKEKSVDSNDKNDKNRKKKLSSHVRNSKGNMISVNFERDDEESSLTENVKNPIMNLLKEKERKKITKPQMKRRDEVADEILSEPDFNKRYNKSENIKAPAKNKSDVAYAIATLIATGRGNQINRGKKKGKKSKKEQQNESLIRINTLREAIRRISQ